MSRNQTGRQWVLPADPPRRQPRNRARSWESKGIRGRDICVRSRGSDSLAEQDTAISAKLSQPHPQFLASQYVGTLSSRAGNKVKNCCGNPEFEHESHLLLQAAILDRFRWTHPYSSRRG